jgi:hypothetical protein
MKKTNLSFPATGASREELEAIIDRGFEAMASAHDAGRNTDVVFCREEGDEEVHKMNDIEGNEVGDEKIVIPQAEGCDDEERKVLDAARDLEMEDPCVCSECGENLCVFDQNELRLMSYDEDEHFHLEEADVPTNNIRRKKLYRQLTLILNGGPMGVGIRRPLPTCCVRKIRDMFPSEEFMGFRWE